MCFKEGVGIGQLRLSNHEVVEHEARRLALKVTGGQHVSVPAGANGQCKVAAMRLAWTAASAGRAG
jgi:hypothetical protein